MKMGYSHLPQEVEDHVIVPLLTWVPSWNVPDTAGADVLLDHNRERAPAVYVAGKRVTPTSMGSGSDTECSLREGEK